MELTTYKLEEIASFSQGKQVDIDNQYELKKDGMKRFIRIVDYTNPNEPIRYVEDFGERYYASKNDLIMIRYGSQTCGKVEMGLDGIIANNMFKINLNNDIILNKYAYYYLKQDNVYSYLRNAQNSSTMPSINFGILNKLEISIPNIEYQKKTVKLLDSVNNNIAKCNQINNLMHELLTKIFNDMFANELNSKNNLIKLEDVAIIKNGYAFKGSDFSDSGIPVIKIKNVKPNKILLDDLAYVPTDLSFDREKYKINYGDVLITMSGNRIDGSVDSWVGKVALFDRNGEYYLNQRVGIISPKCDKINNYFLAEFLSTMDMQKYFIERGTSSGGQANISPTIIKNIEFTLPDAELMKKFEIIASNIYEIIKSNNDKINKLENLSYVLSTKVFSGELSIDNINI